MTLTPLIILPHVLKLLQASNSALQSQINVGVYSQHKSATRMVTYSVCSIGCSHRPTAGNTSSLYNDLLLFSEHKESFICMNS